MAHKQTILSTKAHHDVCKQTASEGREVEDARTGTNAYLQSGHEGKDRMDSDCYLYPTP